MNFAHIPTDSRPVFGNVNIVIAAWLYLQLFIPISHAGSLGRDLENPCELGRQIQEVAQAIENPASEKAIERIVYLGTDSRYYVMVRGWLQQQIIADQSIVDSSDRDQVPRIENRLDILRQALRRIDLE